MSWLEVFVAAGGGGAVVAGVKAISGTVSEVVRTRLHGPAEAQKTRAESQHVDAETAKFFNDLAKEWAAEFRAANAELSKEVRGLRGAVESLTDAVEQAIPVLEAAAAVHPPAGPAAVQLREANRVARLAI